ncbi:hypothetical protein [Azospirillum sp. B4]|uniref:hypothetical protein n=1 Tax=Azospirillum sp. B4 TaxID=95605 RepID=UPI00034B348B|nr:hypothetical protein [Azospirillum sp. B4]
MRTAALLVSCLVAVMLVIPEATMASSPRPPQSIVEGLYQPYLSGPHADKLGGPDALALIRPHASPALARLLDQEKACAVRTRQICALDFDVIIAGQDWNLSGFGLQYRLDGQVGIVTARFVNGVPCAIDYRTILVNGRWVIDDVIIRQADGIPPDQPWSLRGALEEAYAHPRK